MAKQAGMFPFRGTLGNITFYKSADGEFRIRQKTSLDQQRILKDPSYKRFREQMSEFTYASKGVKLFRRAAIEMVKRTSDRNMHLRLGKRLQEVQKSDTTSPRGSRKISRGNIHLLKGFQFSGKPLGESFLAPFQTNIITNQGTLTVEIPGFNAIQMVVGSPGSTHFQLHAVGLAIDFDTDDYRMDLKSSDYYSCKDANVPALFLETMVPAESTGHFFLLFAIEFYVETNGRMYELNNKKDNAMEIVEAKLERRAEDEEQ